MNKPTLPEWSKQDDIGGLVPSEVRQKLARMYRAGMLRAAEIAEATYPERVNGQDVTLPCFDTAAEVADAIRKEAGE